eukprot:CAMPEP_0194365542 /NCGR_PEP_ID=MMETSP0174-20130528/13611_1 /TAXON_ID=216777 /ORGANISM="Proboscia alata, Strain PI-D3" /LENGTH=339 /DNA_ID=CAMNT_0039140301 /DNA_START=47 /DNA_END=1066 /DNA_ORIENTATION=-
MAATDQSYTSPASKINLSSGSSSYKLASGYEMPAVAYGTFRSEKNEVGPAVMEAIKAGYTHFDLAHVYGNEKEIGQAFKNAFEEGLIKREDMFITGKLWNSDHDEEIVPQACAHSLSNLGIDYFDLYLVHFPVAWKHTGLDTPSFGSSELGNTPLIQTWRAMEKLVDDKKCRSIGVSNYPLMLLHDLVTQARVPVSCNQIEVHAYYTRQSLVNYCLSRDICVTAHTPLGGGASNKETWNTACPLDDPIVKKISDVHSKSPAQVLLRFLLQRGIVVLPKSVKSHRIKENLDLFGFGLEEAEMQELHTLDKYVSYKTNPNPIGAFFGGPDAFSSAGTDIFD